MSGKQDKRERRQHGEWAARRERQARWLWESSSLPATVKLELTASARYVATCLRNEPATVPAHWTAPQREAWEAVMADPDARSAALAWGLEGAERLQRKTAHQENLEKNQTASGQ
jgi:hypothetical protein